MKKFLSRIRGWAAAGQLTNAAIAAQQIATAPPGQRWMLLLNVLAAAAMPSPIAAAPPEGAAPAGYKQ